MRIVLLNGGLGNQMFQYIFYRWLEIMTKETCYLDDSFFFSGEKEHNGYELNNIFGLKPNLLSQYFTQDVWHELLNNVKGIPQQLADAGLNLLMFAEMQDYRPFNGNIVMMPGNVQDAATKYSVRNVIGNVYYHGYWVTNDWIDDIYKEIKSDFRFPPITDNVNMPYYNKIRETNSCGIHIRRGDFVELKWTLPPDYYKQAVQTAQKSFGQQVTYYVFSDDIAWCRANEEALGFNIIEKDRLNYVEGNYNHVSNYVDMQLLSECKWQIMSNSSFCYAAALLSSSLKGATNPTKRKITFHSTGR